MKDYAIDMEDQMEEDNEEADLVFADADISEKLLECDCGCESSKTCHVAME